MKEVPAAELRKYLGTRTVNLLMAHLPLWTIYEQWGWGTADAGRALGYLKRFGSLTVLNGHIHQIIQKVEANGSVCSPSGRRHPSPAIRAARRRSWQGRRI